ncbi:MAG: dienelactone hydrolase family protein [Pirellulales bacterium]
MPCPPAIRPLVAAASCLLLFLCCCMSPHRPAVAQALGKADRDAPGDVQIQAYLLRETQRLEATAADDLRSAAYWEQRRPQYQHEYAYMLGLSPTPAATPLEARVTGQVQGDGYVVELLHYQSLPRLYVTANLYRPAQRAPGERFPAVLYVCGHSGRGRNGNKTAFQSHGIWLARHGYVCLIVDTLQLGEIAATHHGTYQEQRWWWQSRGYTPAGVECWNGVRGIDYLSSRPDVAAERIAVTGISGGGAATFWIAAADQRVQVAVPISGMADLGAYVPQRVINGHCDCMFLVNTFQWPWTRIAALVAPRPLLFINSDQDAIFPMDANDRISATLERVYALFGAGDRCETLVSNGGHDYRQDIRQGTFRFLNTWLRHDPRIVTDSEVDLVSDSRTAPQHPLPPEQLRVFPTDADIPADQLNTRIDEHFVPRATTAWPEEGQFSTWKANLQRELRRVTFRKLTDTPAPPASDPVGPTRWRVTSEPGMVVELRKLAAEETPRPRRVVLVVRAEEDPQDGSGLATAADEVWLLDPRGVGATRWTRRNPPNYVERSLALLGDTVAGGQVRDVLAAAAWLRGQERQRPGGALPVYVAGRGPTALVAAYAALWSPDLEGALLIEPPASHQDPAAPAFLNVLRVADVPQILGLLAPKPVTIYTGTPDHFATTRTIYQRAGAPEKLDVMR